MFSGDSRPEEETKKMEALCTQIDEIIAIKRPATLILDDPAGNSHLQVSTAAGESEGKGCLVHTEPRGPGGRAMPRRWASVAHREATDRRRIQQGRR